MEDTLLEWLKRDSRHRNFPIELSRDFILDPEGNDEPVVRLKYENGNFINFPYNSDVYCSAWRFFNKYWQTEKLTLSRKVID